MKEFGQKETVLLDALRAAVNQESELEAELAQARMHRDAVIVSLLGTKVPRKMISSIAGLAEISIYKIAAKERARRVIPIVAEETVPVVREVPEGAHPLLGWELEAGVA